VTSGTLFGPAQRRRYPANGFYDLPFAVFDGSAGGSQIGSTLTSAATAVSKGQFLPLSHEGAYSGY
jgi:hypothetical protein